MVKILQFKHVKAIQIKNVKCENSVNNFTIKDNPFDPPRIIIFLVTYSLIQPFKSSAF